jgi:chromosome segregation ATPase
LNPKNWLIVGLAVALAGAVIGHFLMVAGYKVQIATLSGKVTGLEGQVSARVAERDAAVNNNHSLANRVDEQSRAIKGILEERTRADEAFKKAEAASKIATARHTATIEEIRKFKPHSDDAMAVCRAVEKMVTDYIVGRQGGK